MKNEYKLCEFLYLATTRCNCRCKHCSPSLYTGKDRELTTQKLIERYEESEFLSKNSISVAGGEPFLKNDIEEFILYLDKKKIPCIISTNGWFTDRIAHLLERLEDNQTVRFSISIDGIGEVHDNIRNLEGIFDRAVKSAKLIKDAGFGIQINLVAQKDNYKQIPEMKAMFAEMGIPLNAIPKFKIDDEEFEFNEDEIREVYPEIYFPREKKLLLSKGDYSIEKNCHAGKHSWMLDSNGDVYTCCGGYYSNQSERYILGNLWDTPFDEIFKSERAKYIYENVVLKCKGCANARDIEREVTEFGYSTEYTIEDVSVFKDEITNECFMLDYTCDNFNWNDLEEDGNGSYRWMKNKKASVFLKVPKEVKSIKFKMFNFIEMDEHDNPVWFSVDINGMHIGKETCTIGEAEFEFPLDMIDLKTNEIVKCTITTNLTWNPQSKGMGADCRDLGLGIRSVIIL